MHDTVNTILCVLAVICTSLAGYNPPYLTLPATPELPAALETGYVNLSSGVDIWYAQFGAPLSTSLQLGIAPVVFLHGAFANADWFGNQVSALAPGSNATIIALDSRMQGRSTGFNASISYELMREDVTGVLDYFGIPKVTVIGWSDGAIIGLNMAMNAPERLERLFAFGTSYLVANSNDSSNPINDEYYKRAHAEYLQLSPTPGGWAVASRKINNMLDTLPDYSQSDFNKIPNLFEDCGSAPLIWEVDGADEETIKRTVPGKIRDLIPASGMLILPLVSHYAFLQDPTTFNLAITRFLEYQVVCD